MLYSSQLEKSLCAAIDKKYANPVVRELRKFEKLCGPQIPGSPSRQKWIEQFCFIEDKRTAELGRITMNKPQRIMNAAMDEADRAGVPFRAVTLKARRFGISRFMLLRGWSEIAQRRDFNAAIVANSTRVAGSLLKQLQNNLLGKLPYPPPIDRSNRAEVRFHKPLNSAFIIASAEEKQPLRGDTTGFRFVHCTETAFWTDPKTKALAINQAVPRQAGTFLTHESTANGASGYFYDLFWSAYEKKNSYQAFFFPWYCDPDFDFCFTLNRDEEEKLADTLDDEERWLLTEAGCTLGQLAWRRATIEDECFGDLERFRQEYPSTPEDAFRTPGNRVFNPSMLAAIKAKCEAALMVGELVDVGGRVEFQPSPSGRLRIWRMPEERHGYVIGADAAEGVEQDRSVGQVLDAHTGEQVAVWKSDRTSPGEFGRALALLGRFYREAFVLPERKNPGPAVIEAMIAEGYHMIGRMPQFTSVNTEVTDRLGWDTNSRTKSLMYANARSAMKAGLVTINDGSLCDEMAALYVEATQHGEKIVCPKEMHDDEADAFCIALMASRYASETELYEEPEAQRPKTYSERHWDAIRVRDAEAEEKRSGNVRLRETDETIEEIEEMAEGN
jgi:hypothetical protein